MEKLEIENDRSFSPASTVDPDTTGIKKESMPTVHNTHLLWTTVEDKLNSAFRSYGNLAKNRKVDVIAAGQNFMSVVARYYPKWISPQPDLPTSVILKIPFVELIIDYCQNAIGDKTLQSEEQNDEELQANFNTHARKCHDVEVSVYQFINKTKLHAKIPNSYVLETTEHSGTQAFLALENIQDAFVVPITQYLSISECLQAVEEIAKIHAHSINVDFCSHVLTFTGFQQTHVNEKEKSISKTVEELDPDRLKPLLEKLDFIFTNSEIFEWKYATTLHEQLRMPPVLVHGDLWPANVLWKQKNGKRELAAIIDWQVHNFVSDSKSESFFWKLIDTFITILTGQKRIIQNGVLAKLAHAGCGSEDLQRFICGSLSPEERRRNWRNLIREYYNYLQKYLEKKPTFTLQQVEESFVRLLPFATMFLMPTLGPLILRHVKENTPDKVEESRIILADKAVGILEDCFTYFDAIQSDNIASLF